MPSCSKPLGEDHGQGLMLPKSLSSSRLRSCTLGGRHFEASGQSSLAHSVHQDGKIKIQGAVPHKRQESRRLNAMPERPLCAIIAWLRWPKQYFDLWQTQVSARYLPHQPLQNTQDQSSAGLPLPTAIRDPWASPRVAPPAFPAVTGTKSRELTYPGCSEGIIPDLIS